MLGAGKDGHVWRTSRLSALKIHETRSSYIPEVDAYIRLHELGLRKLAGFNLPSMLDHDDELFAIEMDVVFPPFVVDFASAFLDFPTDLIEDEGHTLADLVQSRFGERSDAVMNFYHALVDRAGIYLSDLHPNNVKFE